MAKISVLGAGSWGTALSVLLSNNGHEVRLWSRFQEEVDALKETRELTSKLPGVHIPENIDLTADVKSCVETAEVIVLAVPSPYIRSTSKLMAPDVKEGQIIVNVAKGIEEKTLMIIKTLSVFHTYTVDMVLVVSFVRITAIRFQIRCKTAVTGCDVGIGAAIPLPDTI